VTYYDNNRIKEKGKYIMGQKEGDWTLYDYDGSKIITIRYEDGVEKVMMEIKLSLMTSNCDFILFLYSQI